MSEPPPEQRQEKREEEQIPQIILDVLGLTREQYLDAKRNGPSEETQHQLREMQRLGLSSNVYDKRKDRPSIAVVRATLREYLGLMEDVLMKEMRKNE